MMEAYLGTIVAWAPNFEPQGWMFCDGRTLSIRDHTAVFSLLGTTYGGNGQTTFQLPDLRGRLPIGSDNQHGPVLGQINHGADAVTSPAFVVAQAPEAGKPPVAAQPVTTPKIPQSLAVNYIICVEGVFPPRW